MVSIMTGVGYITWNNIFRVSHLLKLSPNELFVYNAKCIEIAGDKVKSVLNITIVH